MSQSEDERKMLSVSPNRGAVLAEASRFHRLGDTNAALAVLQAELRDQGIDTEIDAEFRRLFPAPPELLSKLAGYQRELDDPDDAVRRKAARHVNSLVRGTVSNAILQFVHHAETMTFVFAGWRRITGVRKGENNPQIAQISQIQDGMNAEHLSSSISAPSSSAKSAQSADVFLFLGCVP